MILNYTRRPLGVLLPACLGLMFCGLVFCGCGGGGSPYAASTGATPAGNSGPTSTPISTPTSGPDKSPDFAFLSLTGAPDLTNITIDPVILPGGTVTLPPVTISSINGFSSPITLTGKAAVANQDGSFTPTNQATVVCNPATLTLPPNGSAQVQVMVTASAGLPAGTAFSIQVQGQGGGLSRYLFQGGAYTATPANGYELSFATPGISVQFSPNSFSATLDPSPTSTLDGTFILSVTGPSHFPNIPGSAVLSAAGLPPGVTASFNPATLSVPTAADTDPPVSVFSVVSLTVTGSSPAALGTYPITLSATLGGQTYSAPYSLVIAPASAQQGNLRRTTHFRRRTH